MELKETTTEKKVLKVLIVDDDADLGTFMRLKLSMEAPHFSIAFAESGQECLDYLKTHETDCILSDYQMPEMNGMELLLALREAGNDVPFIFVTGQGNEEVAREAFKNGAYDYFTKDFGFAHFARIINSVEQAVKQSQADNAIKERDFWINESQKVARLGTYVLDLQGGRWTSSDILDDIFGIDNTFDKTRGAWSAILHPDDRERMLQYFEGVLAEKKRFEADYKIIRLNDGQERWVSGLGELVLDRDGNPVRMLGTIQDITERKQAEDALRASQKYLQTIIDTEPECVKLVSSGGTLLMMNRAGMAMIEADSPEQVKGKRLFDLIVPEHREAFRALGEKVFRGESGTLGFDMVGFKGRRLRLETHAVPLRNEKDEIIALLGITRDITERKQAEDNLQESEKRFRALVENAADALFLHDGDGRIKDVNQSACDSLGYTREELLNMSVQDIDTAFVSENIPGLWELVVQGRPVTINGMHRRRDGSTFPVEVRVGLLNVDGAGLFLAFARDVTERKQAEVVLKEKERVLTALIDAIPESVVLVDAKGVQLAANAAIAKRLGRSCDELIGCSAFEFLSPELAASRKAHLDEVLRTGRAVSFEDTRDGRVIENHLNPVIEADGHVSAVVIVGMDVTERKRAEDAQRASQKYLQTIFDTEPECVKLLASDGTVVMMNRAGLAMIEADSLEQVKGKSIIDQVVPEYRGAFEALGEKVFQGGAGTLEFDLVGIKGRPLRLETHAVPLRNEKDEIIALLGITRDITERKLAENNLRESEIRLKAILDNIPDLVWLKDKESRFIAVNGSFGRACGVEPANLAGKTDLDIWPKELAEMYRADDRKVIETGKRKSVEEPLIDKEGNSTWIETIKSPIRDNNGEVVGTVGTARDITRRKKAEEELKKFKFIVDSAGEEFYLMDTSGNIIYANDAAARSFGYTMEEMLRLNVSGFNLEYAPIFEKYVCKLKERDIPPFETVHTTKDGRTVPKEVKAVCIQIGGKDYICTFARDISERKNLERQRADFHAMVTHDLKSPLASILGYSDLISKAAQGIAGGDVIDGMAKAVSRGGERLLRLVDDFIAASRLESGGIVVMPMPFEVAGLLLEVRDEFEPIARKRGIAFLADIPDGLPLAVLDKKQVERAVGNLLQNAFNYTPKGGEVRLAAEAVTYGNDKYILVSVSDTGPGIPQEEMDKIFDKYYRSPKAAGTKGTGLGLAIVRAIAEAHGGRVEVESEEGRGSTFRLFLPQ